MLTHNRWLSWKSGAVISVLIGALAATRLVFVTLLAGFVLVAGIFLLLRRKRPRKPCCVGSQLCWWAVSSQSCRAVF